MVNGLWPAGNEHGGRIRWHPRGQHRSRGAGQKPFCDGNGLCGRLVLGVDGFGQALTKLAVGVELREAEIVDGKLPQRGDGLIG